VLTRFEPHHFGERPLAMTETRGDNAVAATPFWPALATMAGMVAGGVVITIKSGAWGRSSIRATQRRPSISRCLGLTR
jgi:hypothetical protein